MASEPIINWQDSSDEPHDLESLRTYFLTKPSYVASPLFLQNTSWVASISQDTLYQVKEYLPFKVSIVGIVSSKELFMNPQGNFEPNSSPSQDTHTTKSFAHAEYQFSLAPPVKYPFFLEDFRNALLHIRSMYEFVKTTPGSYCWETEVPFIDPKFSNPACLTEQEAVFHFAFPIFQKTGLAFLAESQWQSYKDRLKPQYVNFVDALMADFRFQPLKVTCSDKAQINEWDYQTVMEGSLVEVYFTLCNVYGQGLSAEPTSLRILERSK